MMSDDRPRSPEALNRFFNQWGQDWQSLPRGGREAWGKVSIALAQAIAASQPPPTAGPWQPIETAPKDRRWIIGWNQWSLSSGIHSLTGPIVVRWQEEYSHSGGWVSLNGNAWPWIEKWMPAPEAP